MVFDKIVVNDQSFQADGQVTLDGDQVRVTTVNGDVGQVFNQIESHDGKVADFAIYKEDEERYTESALTIKNVTVVGGNYRIELEK